MRWLTFYLAVFITGTTALTTTSPTVAYGALLTSVALLMRVLRPLLH